MEIILLIRLGEWIYKGQTAHCHCLVYTWRSTQSSFTVSYILVRKHFWNCLRHCRIPLTRWFWSVSEFFNEMTRRRVQNKSYCIYTIAPMSSGNCGIYWWQTTWVNHCPTICERDFLGTYRWTDKGTMWMPSADTPENDRIGHRWCAAVRNRVTLLVSRARRKRWGWQNGLLSLYTFEWNAVPWSQKGFI